MSSGRAPTPAGHQCSPCENFVHTRSVKLNIMGLWEWGIYGVMGEVKNNRDMGMGHLWLNRSGIYDLMGRTVMA